MAVSEAAAERLYTLHANELGRSLRPPVHSKVNARQTRALLRRVREGGPGMCEEPDATTWVWSDLHLGHEDSLTAFDRRQGRRRRCSSRPWGTPSRRQTFAPSGFGTESGFNDVLEKKFSK